MIGCVEVIGCGVVCKWHSMATAGRTSVLLVVVYPLVPSVTYLQIGLKGWINRCIRIRIREPIQILHPIQTHIVGMGERCHGQGGFSHRAVGKTHPLTPGGDLVPYR